MASTAVDKGSGNPQAEAEVKKLQAELEALKAQLEERLKAVESKLPATGTPVEQTVSAETLAVIAVAVTQFLGKKVKIRSARLVQPANSWGQAGRATIQASHNLTRPKR